MVTPERLRRPRGTQSHMKTMPKHARVEAAANEVARQVAE